MKSLSVRYDTPEYVYVNSFRGDEIRPYVQNVMTDVVLISGEKRERVFLRDEATLNE